MENEKKKQQCKIAKSNKIMPKSHKADSDSHDVLCSLCSKLLGGGVESMAITEAFGGEETPAFLFINPKVSQQIITCLIYKKWILSLFVRVPHRKNPAVSHALWWVKQFQASFLHMTWTFLFLREVTAQLPGENGYSGGKVIFIDTENTLYPYG